MTGSRKRENWFIRRKGPAGGLALLIFMAAGPAVLLAQDENFFYPDSFFQTPAGQAAGVPSLPPSAGVPPLPPSAADPFALPPSGSIPLGSAEPPMTSPSSSPPEAETPDDPFGTPAPESRQVRQIGPAVAPAESGIQVPATAVPATAGQEARAPAASAALPALPAYSAPSVPVTPVPAVPVPAAPAEIPQARQTLEEAQRARLKALFPDMLPPPDQNVSALTAPPPVLAEPEQLTEDEAAIARAGALLTRENYGQAKILPPLDLPPAREETPAKPETEEQAPAQEPPAQEPAAQTPAAQTKAPPAKAPAAQTKAPPAKAPAAKPKATPAKAGQGKKAPVPAPARGALALVNETGDPQVGALYQSALSRLGYTILSGPAGGFSGGPAGRTVIFYRPGAQARAQAVSRDIPGRKTLAEAPPGAAAADIVVVLR